MASPNVSFNPAIQTTFAGTFFATSDGYTAGDALDDPAIRFQLRRGIVSPSVTQVMWGGLAICETLTASPSSSQGVGATSPANDLQSILTPATSLSAGNAAGLLGWTVFNQATAMLQTAQSRVPVAGSSGAISFYRSGSKARIPIQALPAAAVAWAGGVTDPQTIYWDVTNLQLCNASSGTGIGTTIGPITNVTIDAIGVGNCRTVSYNGTTNFANWVETGSCVVLIV
jgi:hypothetical protein